MKVTPLFCIFILLASCANYQPAKEIVFSDEYFTITHFKGDEFLVEGQLIYPISTNNVSEKAQNVFSASVQSFCKGEFKVASFFVMSGDHPRRGISGKGEIPSTFKKTIKCINFGENNAN